MANKPRRERRATRVHGSLVLRAAAAHQSCGRSGSIPNPKFLVVGPRPRPHVNSGRDHFAEPSPFPFHSDGATQCAAVYTTVERVRGREKTEAVYMIRV